MLPSRVRITIYASKSPTILAGAPNNRIYMVRRGGDHFDVDCLFPKEAETPRTVDPGNNPSVIEVQFIT